ncbi:MAG: hypothetical protein M3071_08800, partial [Actinomycetota bacterium]|nr:hypothetical protein [Actinomycetota bacterium]
KLKRRRVGQRQAEAAARAARFVEARSAESAARNGSQATTKPVTQPTPRPQPAPWKNQAVTSPFGLPGMAPVTSPGPGRLSPSTARARAIERALAKGRSLPEPGRRRPPPARSEIDADDVPLGFLIISIVLVELILGGVVVAVSGGLVVLGLGLTLDAGARAIGTITAARSGTAWGSGWRWICALGGSPGVIVFAFQRDGSLLGTGPLPMAGPVAAVALFVLLVGLAGLPAGI